MAVILTGKPVADALSADTARRAGALRQRGVSPRLVILRCGENEADGAYIRGAVKRGALCGVEVELRALPADATAADVREAIREINGERTRLPAAAAAAAPSAGGGGRHLRLP